MGKQMSERKKSSSNTLEIEEREKLKESILKVFRDRYESPSKGGGVAIVQTRQNEQLCESRFKEMMSGKSKSKRKSSRQKKSSNNKSPAVIKSDSAVAKHLKVAHGIVYNHGKNKGEHSLVNRIAPSRLTHKCGIFNLGKRSRPATRGLFVPERIQLQTEEDIKKIIEEVHMDSPPLDTNTMPESERFSKTDLTLAKITDTASWISNNKTPNSIITSFIISSKTACRSETSSIEIDPQKLALKDTINEILLPLGPLSKQMFPKKDCLKETVSVLQKLLKQNAPRSATPTPIPVLNKIRSSGGIQRSLFTDCPGPSHNLNSTGLTSGTSHQNNALDTFEDDPVGEYQTTTCRLYEKINNHHTDPRILKPTPSHSDHGINDLDIHYYRCKVLGTEKRNGVLDNRNGQELFSNRSSINKEIRNPSVQLHSNEGIGHDLAPSTCKQFNSAQGFSIQQNKRSTYSLEGNNSVPRDYRDRGFRINNRSDMKPKDEFSAFFEDFKYEPKRCTMTDNTPCVPRRPVDDSLLHITKPISPLVVHQPVGLLHASDRGSHLQYEPMDCETRKEDAIGLLEKNDLMESIYKERLSQDSEPCCGELRQNSQTSNASSTNSAHKKVLYMPGFHSDFYTDHLSAKDILWQKSGLYSKVNTNNHPVSGSYRDLLTTSESMDILDQVDLDTAMEEQHGQSCIPETRDILHVASMNTESTSIWKPSTAPYQPRQEYHKPPLTHQDSPGITMLPRKMY